ncbi:MAG: hypothetical protein JWN31_1128 [Frankiales bacterium]|nr:hypothetical protein [Frankiales bacterium]
MSRQVLRREQVLQVVGAAGLASSVHNTQPWRFEWDETTLLVLQDTTRTLPVLDPLGRERLLSCGAAVLNALVALRSQGFDAHAEVEEAGDVVARVRIAGTVVPDKHDLALAAAIRRRFTDRSPFADAPIEPAALDRLRAAAEHHGAWLRSVEGTDERVALSVLLSRADLAETQDPRYLEELVAWRSFDGAPEGVPDAALSPGGRGSEFALRDFDAAAPAADGGVVADPPAAEHPFAAVLGTAGDSRRDWVLAGMALSHVLLQATVEGLSVSPMTQVVEMPALRERLRLDLGLVGEPQVVLRIGRPGTAATGPVTGRRQVADVLTFT